MDYLLVAWGTMVLVALLLAINNWGRKKGNKPKPPRKDIIEEIRRIMRRIKIDVRL
jgi:hypothetical protein